MKQVDRRLTNAINESGTSRARMADRLGVSRSCLWRWETGNRKCPVIYRREIAKILHKKPIDLWEGGLNA